MRLQFTIRHPVRVRPPNKCLGRHGEKAHSHMEGTAALASRQ